MNQTVSIPLLRENLRGCPAAQARIAGLSEGARYLYDALYLPMLAGKEVTFGELDYARFDRDDLISIHEFHEKTESRPLFWMYGKLRRTSAALRPAAFI
jgi:hypothetical protein